MAIFFLRTEAERWQRRRRGPPSRRWSCTYCGMLRVMLFRSSYFRTTVLVSELTLRMGRLRRGCLRSMSFRSRPKSLWTSWGRGWGSCAVTTCDGRGRRRKTCWTWRLLRRLGLWRVHDGDGFAPGASQVAEGCCSLEKKNILYYWKFTRLGSMQILAFVCV